MTSHTSTPTDPRRRIRDLGLSPGVLPTGPLNAITDVAGVRVGHATLVEGDAIRTGVTAILPHGDNLFQDRVPAGLAVGNGFGKLAGATQLVELGELETPILLTNTLAVSRAADALISYTLAQPGNAEVRSVNPVVGECNDGMVTISFGRAPSSLSASRTPGSASTTMPSSSSGTAFSTAPVSAMNRRV